MSSNPAKLKGERRPVETVSWEDAQAFLEKLNARKDRCACFYPST